MDGYPSKDTEIVRAENLWMESLEDKSFSDLNFQGESGVLGALFVVVFLLLACLGYGIARYEAYDMKCSMRTNTSLEIFKPSCPICGLGDSRTGHCQGSTCGKVLTK